MTMTAAKSPETLSAADHAAAMADYIREGEARARALGNRGPLRLDADGRVAADIIEAYWRQGFYIFEGLIGAEELAELRADADRVLAGAPVAPDAEVDAQGRPAIGREFSSPSFTLERPLSDPVGGTTKNNGRHPAKMLEPTVADGAPAWTVARLRGNLQIMDAALRLYGHPGILAVAAAINGPDFVPFNEVTFVKEPGLGPSVAWHRDGTTHWEKPDWDQGAHGFNSMTQLYPCTAANCVWVLPGTHKLRQFDIRAMVADSGSDRIPGAVPMVCAAGDVCIVNRQLVHGSFANSSPDRRITLNAGFHPRKRVLDQTVRQFSGKTVVYDAERVEQRTRMIQIGIDARRQRFPDEQPFRYQPFVGREDENRWTDATRETVVKDYNLRDMYI